MAINIRLIFLFLLPLCLDAQTVDVNRLVTFRYQNQQLGFILSDISRKYAIPFSYSSNFIPVAKRISINKRRVKLKDGLDELFAPTQIVYAVFGNSIALKIDESKEVVPIIEKPTGRKHNIKSEQLSLLKREAYPILVWEHLLTEEELTALKARNKVWESTLLEEKEEALFMKKEFAQVTLVPPFSTNREQADKISNTFSFNIFYGRNGGLDGMEIGGGVNNIVNDMSGFQLAGVGNMVEGDMQGGQVAAFFNYNKGFSRGVQASLFNVASTANLIQLAGFANVVQEDFKGIQFALGGNYVRTRAEGPQIAGLFNHSDGSAKTQVAVGMNKTDDLQNLQIGLINIANTSKGKQIGLINIANQTEKTPIGLFSFVKGGYNKIELSASEALYANIGFKFGLKKFYNILQFGSQFTNDIWSLGYGIGTAFKLKDKQFFHLEYIASHVNEQGAWTKELNLLNQIKFQFDWQLKGNNSFFIGPSWNLMASKLKNEDTMEVIGSNLPSYTILDTNMKNTNWKMWFGLNGGFRF
jgi:hypothetical protein